MIRFGPVTKLAKAGVLGMNSRNLDFITSYNPRRFYPLVDDKVITKKLAIEAGVTVPELYGVIRYGGEMHIIEEVAEKHRSFVVKPANGSGGGGIMVFNGVAKTGLRRMNGQIMSQVDKDTTVRSVYLFGKKHRPDLTINEDGIAVEIKYLSGSLDGLKQAIGQSIFTECATAS